MNFNFGGKSEPKMQDGPVSLWLIILVLIVGIFLLLISTGIIHTENASWQLNNAKLETFFISLFFLLIGIVSLYERIRGEKINKKYMPAFTLAAAILMITPFHFIYIDTKEIGWLFFIIFFDAVILYALFYTLFFGKRTKKEKSKD